jgi:hypothetical protein
MIMVIESRTMIGAAGAFAVVGAALWYTLAVTSWRQPHAGTVEVQQIQERSWTVEVKELGAAPVATAANRQ